MKIIYATDQHIKGRNHGSRLDDFPAAMNRKMDELVEVCLYEQPDALVLGGDLYDTPRVSFSLIITMARKLRKIRKLGIPIFLVPGNHDLYGYSMDTIDQTAIGVLAEAGLVRLLTRKKSYLITDSKGVTVELHGREYDKDIDLLPKNDYQIDRRHNARWDFLFSHGMLLEKPFHPDVRHSVTSDVETDADLVLNGHYHDGYPLHEVNGTLFGNPGSTGRDEICKRMPQYAIIEATKKKFTVDYVEYASAENYADIFDFSVKVAKKTHERYLEAFEQTIQDAMTFDAYDAKDVLLQLTQAGSVDQNVIDAAEAAIALAEQANHDGKLDGYIEKKVPLAINKIEIENFQSHAKTTVEFSETGLNAITGASDSGKSAIIRALRWVFYNEPKGSEFIRHGESRATVTVHFSDGSSITRTRTHSDAGSYVIRDAGGTEKEFKGFGTNMPIDVANTHQMPRVELAPGMERPLNFSYQLDGHFLLSESAGTRAATIGRLTGVHIVDAAIKEKKRELTNLTKDINASQKRVEDLDEQLLAYDDLPGLKGQVDLASVLINGAVKIENEITELREAAEEILEEGNKVKLIQKQLEEYDDVAKAEKLLAKAEVQASELSELTGLYQELVETSRQVKHSTKVLESYANVSKAEKLVEKLETGVAEIKELQDLYSDMIEAEGAVLIYEKQLDRFGDMTAADAKIEQAEALIAEVKELNEVYRLMSIIDDEITILESNLKHQQEKEAMGRARMKTIFDGLGNKCPMCQSDLDDEHMEHIVDAV